MLAWLFAHQHDRGGARGELLYRIEDLDTERGRFEVAVQQRADLETLGLSFEPPLVVQSTRMAAYRAALDLLSDRTYECFCSRQEIAEASSAPHGVQRRYPGTCRDLTPAQRDSLRQNRPPAIRLRADPVEVTVNDILHGCRKGVPEDVVLYRNNGTPAYHLAAVTDDTQSGVTQVVRGDDLLDAAISQTYLAGLLGSPPLQYAHVPLVLNPDGRRLAKRDGAVTPADLAARGVDAAQTLSILATSLNLADPGEPVTLTDISDRFDPAVLPTGPWIYHPA